MAQLARQGSLPDSPLVITTEVTTGQITRIGHQFGAQVVNDLLVGFKYHADVLWQLETTGRYGDFRGSTSDFVIATEESHGILTTPHIRDKDSAGAALLLAELALHLKRQGRTVPEYLNDLARKFGYFRNELRNLVMTGVEGKRDMARMLDALRTYPPKQVGGLAVVAVLDEFPGEEVLGVTLLVIGFLTAAASYRRWALNERAMRLDESLPHSRLPLLLAVAVSIVALVAAVLLVVDAA